MKTLITGLATDLSFAGSAAVTLGNYRWLLWRVRRTIQRGDTSAPKTGFTSPEYANITFAQNPDGLGTVLRVWEQAGVSGEVTVTLPEGARFTSAQPVNLRGEPAGQRLAIRSGSLTFTLPRCAPASFVLTPELPLATATPTGPRTTTPLSSLNLSGVQTLTLQVTDAGDGNSADHADWIAPEITHTGGLL
jgi:hypothetical protein